MRGGGEGRGYAAHMQGEGGGAGGGGGGSMLIMGGRVTRLIRAASEVQPRPPFSRILLLQAAWWPTA